MKKPVLSDEDKTSVLKQALHPIFTKYHTGRFIGMDPLCCVRPFKSNRDREIAGLVASSIAYGRVEQIIKSVTRLFDAMNNRPYDFAVNTTFFEKKAAFNGFKHRFNTGYDLALLMESLKTVLRDYNSIENLFVSAINPGDASVRHALEQFTLRLRGMAHDITGKGDASFNYLLSSPASGSACKRMNMFLRWMVRREDGVDMGVWKKVSPALLVMPVDVHVARAGRALKLTGRKSADWLMAEQITDALKKIDPADPVKYDFSLCRYGMMVFRNGK